MVLPVGDQNPTRSTPFVTGTFIAINVAVFFLANVQLGQQTCDYQRFLFSWAAIPAELTTLRDLAPDALPSALADCVGPVLDDTHPLLTAVTSMFLHGGLLHLLFNMLFLWVFGNNVEDRLGHVRYLLFYLAGGVASAYAFALLNPDTVIPLVGASGAIAAVLGGYFLMYPRARVNTYVPFPLYLIVALIPRARIVGWFFFFAVVALPAWLVLGFWFLTEWLALGESARSGVATEAHVAGFLVGMLFTVLLGARQPRRRAQPDGWQ